MQQHHIQGWTSWQKITHIDLKVLYLNNNDKCLFILQNKKRNLVGFPVIVNHMYMNKAAREYHKHQHTTTLGDKPHPAIGKWNFEIKPFLKDTKGKKPFQANSFKWILYIEIFSVISVEFGAVIEPSISPTSDADEHFNITKKYTFEMQDLS